MAVAPTLWGGTGAWSRPRSPCPEPDGGWVVVDASKVNFAARDAALELARSVPEYAGGWVSGQYGEAVEEDTDPASVIVNLKFTGDLDGKEDRIRQVWGGALCVAPARYSESDLLAIQRRVFEDFDGMYTSWVDIFTNQVEAELYLVTDDMRRRADELYGPGAVAMTSWLQPITGG